MRRLLLVALLFLGFASFCEAQNLSTGARATTEIAVLEEYDNVRQLSNGFYSVKKGNQVAVANTEGKLISEFVDEIMTITGDYIQLIKMGENKRTYCAIMRILNGKMITGFDFAWVFTPKPNGLVPVKLLRGDNLGRTDKMLKLMGDDFYVVGESSEGMYPITDFKSKKMGVMAEDGKIIVPPKYDEVGDFHCGMCQVWIAEKGIGFINKSGSLVIPCKYPQALDFGTIQGVSNYTQVWDNWGNTYYIDKMGNIANPDNVMREAYNSQRQNSWY